MSNAAIHEALVWLEIGLAIVTFIALLFITAPYGRHMRSGFGPSIPSRVGWIVMESPTVLVFIAVFVAGEHSLELTPLILLGLWQAHYVHRTLIYPFRIRANSKRMPLLVVVSAVAFNLLNAYINARFISHIGSYADAWLQDPRFLAGTVLFLTGMVINIRADTVLIRLRSARNTGYQIPRGGLYDSICCPNYFGEILEWLGWALATWSLAGLAFAAYTIANLLPRALAHRRWYAREFDDHPRRRKALIPYVL